MSRRAGVGARRICPSLVPPQSRPRTTYLYLLAIQTMNPTLLLSISFIITTECVKPNSTNKTAALAAKKISDHEKTKPQNKLKQKTNNDSDVITISPRKDIVQTIDPDILEQWAQEISEILLKTEERVVHKQSLVDGFKEAKIRTSVRNGSAIVEQMARRMEDLLTRRVKAAENIMRRAETLSSKAHIDPPPDYTYDHSVNLDELKKKLQRESEWDLPETCRSLDKIHVYRSAHFDADVSLNSSSVQPVTEIFDCDPTIVKHLYWSEGLLSTFKDNYAQDASTAFQYFCSAKGFLRHYPAAVWNSLFKLPLETEGDVYDCRLRPWYVSASGAPRDVLVLVDASGSMNGSSNQVIARHFTHTLLNALTDDDQVNVLRFNLTVKSPIDCFDGKLVPADHVNTAAMMSVLDEFTVHNTTNMTNVLRYAVNMLKRLNVGEDRTPSCQQAIVLVTDSLDYNFTDLMRTLDKTGRIRLFVIWLHDQYGIRDNTRELGQLVSCDRDGYFAEMISDNDVTEQVRKILQVFERPLVAQREKRLKSFSDVYAHVEEPRRSEFYWRQKENEEQAYRYMELRRHKARFLNDSVEYQARLDSLDEMGFYYEGEDINFRLQISVSVPVFDHATLENITIKLDEENQRNATRTYPVNRLLGVAGVDIPVDHLKLILPYYQLGPGGALFVIDHRGNIVLHDNLKPLFDGDMLKPGYRTVDFIHLEQPAKEYVPRHYPTNWMEFRNHVIKHSHGIRVIDGKNVFESGMRISLEQREYYWRRVVDHYTAVVVLPPYARNHAAPDPVFTQKAAAEALKSLSRTDFAVHPDWMYCKHVEPHFESRELEVLHFIRRRSDEPNFAMQRLEYPFSLYGKLPPGLLDKTYQCSPELMARLCREAVATNAWAQQHDELDCPTCGLGSVTAFFVGESGLTRWRQYTMTSSHASPPAGSAWARGPDEPWYRRAAAAQHGELLVHAPVSPMRRMRRTESDPPPLGLKGEWLTAARAVTLDKGIIGVAGFHFHPLHLDDVFIATTRDSCEDPKCKVSCDGVNWTCVLVDEGGWIVSGGPRIDGTPEDPARLHLAKVFPTAMAAMLKAKVFTLNWLHDYQGVCFGMEPPNSATILPSLVKSVWRTVNVLMQAMHQIIMMTALLSSSGMVTCDTQKEKSKRRIRVRREFEREKYDRLFDLRVLVNRSEYAACDRSRPFYELQRTPQAMEALRKGAHLCSWPLVGAPVPRTNLLLLAIYTPCRTAEPHRAVPDPLVNQKVDVDELISAQGWGALSPASKLACFRNVVPLPGRARSQPCFQHNYSQEQGYRQCGPWLPDPEVEETTDGSPQLSTPFTLLLSIFIIHIILYIINTLGANVILHRK